MFQSLPPRAFDMPVLLNRMTQGALRRGRPVVFLVGSPLACPDLPGRRGVPGVSGVIDLIREEISAASDAAHRFESELERSSQKYQTAFEMLVAFRGQDVANEVIKRAVLKAVRTDVSKIQIHDDAALERIERDSENWDLPAGVRALGQLIAAYPSVFGRTVLTSNFDPLLELSIRKAGGSYYQTTLHGDGDLTQTTAEGCHVVHYHGYWRGRDTLHTPSQLTQSRPRLEGSLRQLISSSTVVVVGCGGWDDVFAKALVNVVVDDNAHPDVIWTFFDKDWDRVVKGSENLFRQLEPGIARNRISFYAGIDCNNFFPRLLQEVAVESSSDPILISGTATSRLVEVRGVAGEQSRFELRIQLPDPFAPPPTDAPPKIGEWVGREPELDLIARTAAPLTVITGIGGQGKSSLAAKIIDLESRGGIVEGWDWRDCREEGDRLNTQILRIIGRLSDGSINTAHLETLDIASLTEVLFNVLGFRRWIFVFDNVDHYVDLVGGGFLAGLEVLSRAITHRSHQSKFIFTCRPEVRTESSHILPVRLTGLSEGEAIALFAKRGVVGQQEHVLREAIELTGGHPMWINMIAIHVVGSGNPLAAVIADIRRGRGELPERTLRSIWKGLNDHQRALLRTLAEIERPEPEEQVFEMAISPNWNRFSKTLKALRTRQLVVEKSGFGGREVLELHPLVKAFIRREFPRQERERFISPIIKYLEKMMGRYKGVLDQAPSLAILDHWIQKAEVEANRGRLEEASRTLMEVSKALRAKGYGEEFVRIGKRILHEIDWAEACVSFGGFSDLVDAVIEMTTQLGQFEESEALLSRYEDAIPGKSALYIQLCALRCNLYWFWQKFDLAIVWGERGEELKKTSGVDTGFSCAHGLALARRDSGDYVAALNEFLGAKTLEELLNEESESEELGGAYYGNIGRCLHLQGQLGDALKMYRKSARILEADESHIGEINRGYVRFWIGEALKILSDVELAKVFLSAAIYRWREIAPPRAALAITALRETGTEWDESLVDKNMAVSLERVVRGWLRE